MLLCLLHPDCRSVSYAGVDSDCMGASVCPRPLSFSGVPQERHYTLDLPHGGAACEQAEAEANATSAEVAAAVGHDTGGGPRVGLGKLCSSITPAAVGLIPRNRPETTCSSGSHGVWTLAASETSSWPAAVRGCLRRCARCARCRFITVAPTHSLCMWHQACSMSSSSAEDAGEDAAAIDRAPQRAPQAPPATAEPPPASACGFRSGRVLRHEQLRARSTMALVFFGKFGSSGRSSAMISSDNASFALIERTHAAFRRNLLAPNAHVHVDVFAHSWSPEAAEAFGALWGPLLVKAVHEPTLLADSTSAHLAIQVGSQSKPFSQTLPWPWP